MRSGRACVVARPSKVTEPRSGSSRPEMARSSVDLPEPLVPSRATISPGSHVEIDTEQHLHAVVVDVEAAHRAASAVGRPGQRPTAGPAQVEDHLRRSTRRRATRLGTTRLRRARDRRNAKSRTSANAGAEPAAEHEQHHEHPCAGREDLPLDRAATR